MFITTIVGGLVGTPAGGLGLTILCSASILSENNRFWTQMNLHYIVIDHHVPESIAMTFDGYISFLAVLPIHQFTIYGRWQNFL